MSVPSIAAVLKTDNIEEETLKVIYVAIATVKLEGSVLSE